MIIKNVLGDNPPAPADVKWTFVRGAEQIQLGHQESAERTVPAGEYRVTENGRQGYRLQQIRCDDNDSVQDGADAVYRIAPNETVTCTFDNEQLALVTIVKELARACGDA